MNEYGTSRDTWSESATYAVKGCCIRFPETGPEILADNSHVSVGIASVSIDDATGHLCITHDRAAPVVALSTVLDETLMQRGLTVGGSGGGGRTLVFFKHPTAGLLNLKRADHYALFAGPTANLWYSVIHVHDRGAHPSGTPEVP